MLLYASLSGCGRSGANGTGGGMGGSDPPGAMAAANHLIIDGLFNKCGDVWLGKSTDAIFGKYTLLEARGVHPIFGPPAALTDADRASGVEYRGDVFMRVDMSRNSNNDGKTWTEWKTGLNGSPFFYPRSGVHFSFQKRSGKWMTPSAALNVMTPAPCI